MGRLAAPKARLHCSNSGDSRKADMLADIGIVWRNGRRHAAATGNF